LSGKGSFIRQKKKLWNFTDKFAYLAAVAIIAVVSMKEKEPLKFFIFKDDICM